MLDAQGGILYVGKAKNLKKRVSNYFLLKSDRDPKTRFLIAKIHAIDTIVTQTEEEALILERQLIQLYQPRYNIALKDDKNYPYIKITQEPFPRVFVSRQRFSDGARYFGPYPALGSTKQFLRFLHDLFPLRDCKQAITLDTLQPKCLKLDLGKCIGPCVIKTCLPTYQHFVTELELLLLGKSRELIDTLTQTMQTHSHALQFEKAAQVRDKLLKLQTLLQRPQRVQLDVEDHFQVWVYVQNDYHHYALIQTFIEGKLLYQKGFYLTKTVTQHDFLEEAVLHFMKESLETKSFIFLCDDAFFALFQQPKIAELLPKAQIQCPQRGEKKRLLELAQKNAVLAVEKVVVSTSSSHILAALQKALGLSRCPFRILGVDISHLQGTDIVGSVVYFRDGLPYKSMYRRFLIKTVKGKSHDPLSIYEVVLRRLNRILQDGEVLPDLILIDGGKPQLNFAMKAYRQVGIQNIPLISLAKREEEVFFYDKPEPLKLPLHDPALQLLQRVRNEAHRFAVTYQKRLRNTHFQWALSEIKGIGTKRTAELYKQYGSLSVLAGLSVETLVKEASLGKALAEKVIAFAQLKEKNRVEN